MAQYVAFLRGINVGGHRRMSMARLAEVFTEMGLGEVRTLLASGNVLFAAGGDRRRLAARIEKGLKKAYGQEIGVLMRSAEELRRLARAAPFRGVRVTAMTRLFVTFLPEKTGGGLKAGYVSPDGSFRILRVTAGEVCSVLTLGPQWSRNLRQMDILERECGKRITTRTWSTVLRVVKNSSQSPQVSSSTFRVPSKTESGAKPRGASAR
jgi:uncharacterized protein (DUF1697 family)